jgi:phage shock protein A
MRARAGAVQELEAAGTFEDLTQLGSGEDDIDRQLKALSSTTEVDAELAKMKAEIGGPSAAKGELGAGAPAAGGESSGASQEQAQ